MVVHWWPTAELWPTLKSHKLYGVQKYSLEFYRKKVSWVKFDHIFTTVYHRFKILSNSNWALGTKYLDFNSMSWGLYIPNSIFYIIQIVLRVIDIIRVNFTTDLPRSTTLNQIKTNVCLYTISDFKGRDLTKVCHSVRALNRTYRTCR